MSNDNEKHNTMCISVMFSAFCVSVSLLLLLFLIFYRKPYRKSYNAPFILNRLQRDCDSENKLV